MSTRTPVGIFTEKISELQELYISKNDQLDRALLVNERLETSIKSLTHALEETRSQLKKMGQQNKILESENKNLRYQLKNSQIHNSDLQQFQNAVLEVVNKKSKHSSNHNEQTKNAFGSSRSPKSKHPIRHSSRQDTKGKQSNYKRNEALNTTRVSNTTTESEQERFERFEEMQKKQQNRSAMEEMNQDLLKIQKDFENVFQEKNHQPTKKEKTPFNPKVAFTIEPQKHSPVIETFIQNPSPDRV